MAPHAHVGLASIIVSNGESVQHTRLELTLIDAVRVRVDLSAVSVGLSVQQLASVGVRDQLDGPMGHSSFGLLDVSEGGHLLHKPVPAALDFISSKDSRIHQIATVLLDFGLQSVHELWGSLSEIVLSPEVPEGNRCSVAGGGQLLSHGFAASNSLTVHLDEALRSKSLVILIVCQLLNQTLDISQLIILAGNLNCREDEHEANKA